MSQTTKTTLMVGLCVLGIGALYFSITRSISTDVDPYQKVNVPGYYNGPMKPRSKRDAPAGGGIPGETAPVGSR